MSELFSRSTKEKRSSLLRHEVGTNRRTIKVCRGVKVTWDPKGTDEIGYIPLTCLGLEKGPQDKDLKKEIVYNSYKGFRVDQSKVNSSDGQF